MTVSADTPPYPAKVKGALLTDKIYDVLKFLALIALPALAVAYYGLASIWGLPKPDEVSQTIVVVDTLLGVLLGISTRSYNNSDAKYDGTIDVAENADGSKVASLNLANYTDPADVVAQKQVTFKVNQS